MGLSGWFHKGDRREAGPAPRDQPQGEASGRLPPERDAERSASLEQRVVAALRNVYDPEIPVNIYDLGLVYGLDIDEATGRVQIRMTLTAPACPVAQTFPAIVENAVQAVQGVDEVAVDLVWDPPWSEDLMSEAARLELGML
jgi:FeS assembly SUF system protein